MRSFRLLSPLALLIALPAIAAPAPTSSIAQNTPSPRTSPTLGCFAMIFCSSGPITSVPSLRAFSTIFSSLKMPMLATTDAHASGCPE